MNAILILTIFLKYLNFVMFSKDLLAILPAYSAIVLHSDNETRTFATSLRLFCNDMYESVFQSRNELRIQKEWYIFKRLLFLEFLDHKNSSLFLL
jgi:hypothetical protein